jgi:hypothetical protein
MVDGGGGEGAGMKLEDDMRRNGRRRRGEERRI